MDLSDILAQTALSYVGVVDKPTIDQFRRAVDGHAENESWCLGFIWHCLSQVMEAHPETVISVPHTELVANLWDHSPAHQKSNTPRRGSIAVWNKLGTIHGHCGIVTEVPNPSYFRTVEGNTQRPVPPNDRGVWLKTRFLHPLRKPVPGDFVLNGFLNPFA